MDEKKTYAMSSAKWYEVPQREIKDQTNVIHIVQY